MAKKLRLTIVLTLLVAFGLAGLLPAAGSLSCPDGTTCVYTAGRGYHCLGERCRMACCAAKKSSSARSAGTCCRCCGSGAGPGVTASAGSHGRTIGEPAHCRYREAQRVEPAWIRGYVAPDLQRHAVALLPAPVRLPVVGRFWEQLAPIRGSPPSAHLTPLSSPRAPPGPHCA